MDRNQLEIAFLNRGYEDTNIALQEILDLKYLAVHKRLKGVVEFGRDEIKKIVDKLNLTEEEIVKIFFN